MKDNVSRIDYDDCIVRYYNYQNITAYIPRDLKDYIYAIFSKNQNKIIVADKRYKKVIPKILRIKRIDYDIVKKEAYQFWTLAEAVALLSKKGVKCYFFNRVGNWRKKGFPYDASALYRMDKGLSFPKMAEDYELYKEEFKRIIGEECTSYYVNQLLKVPQIIDKNGIYRHEDCATELVNVVGGKRIVTCQPSDYAICYHIYGRCGVFGYAVEDKDTFPSFLQSFFNNSARTKKVSVQNEGLWGGENEYIFNNFIKQSIRYDKDDVVVFYQMHLPMNLMDILKKCGLRYFDITDSWHKSDIAKWAFYDRPGHMAKEGYKLVAEIIGKILIDNFERKIEYDEEFTESIGATHYNSFIRETNSSELETNVMVYVAKIFNEYRQKIEGYCNGAIVMNCNPFTLGHRYLIEQASKQVDFLFVFVVEEDRSKFMFEDRIDMVKKGASDLGNVIVLPSGKYMISTITFPEYFLKDYVNKKEFDVSMDLELFGQFIAPRLNIQKRFAGTEPTDQVTNNYNENMRRILPEYGVEFIEIDRLMYDGQETINATVVRKLLEKRDFNAIAQYVPETTLNILREKY